jgi:hypothetical protein
MEDEGLIPAGDEIGNNVSAQILLDFILFALLVCMYVLHIKPYWRSFFEKGEGGIIMTFFSFMCTIRRPKRNHETFIFISHLEAFPSAPSHQKIKTRFGDWSCSH